MGHRQTEEPQIWRRRTRRPIWGYSACLENFHRKTEYNLKITPDAP